MTTPILGPGKLGTRAGALGLALGVALLAVGCSKKKKEAAVPPDPVISATVPPSGTTAGGTLITIYGSNFAATPTVSIGGAPATGIVLNGAGTEIQATTPSGTAGPADVVVANPSGKTATQVGGFTYVAAGPGPTITSLSPNFGNPAGGTVVTITGTGFSGTPTVYFGSTSVTVTSATSTTIVVTAPAGPFGGSTNVTVVNPSGLSTTFAGGFTFVPAPTVSFVNPPSGTYLGGTAITITGSDFRAGATVLIGTSVATGVTVVNSTTITATTASSATTGSMTVRVTNADGQFGTRAGGYSYLGPPPTVTSVSPTSGYTSGGTLITLTGTGFQANATVTVGGVLANSITVVSSTSITCRTPAGTAGPKTVRVINTDAQWGELASAFTYVPPPVLTAISPTAGTSAGGTLVTLTGSAFTAGATVTIGGTLLTGVSVPNSTTITGTTGAHAIGPATIVVTNPDGQSSSLLNGYTYSTTPTVTAINPNIGYITGGLTVTITGTSFVAGATADLGGVPLAALVVTGTTQITAVTGVTTTPGIVDVKVTNPANFAGTLTGGWSYIYSPNYQTSQYVLDASATGANRRWYLNFSYSQFTTDLLNDGLQTTTPADAVNAYALDWMRAYVLRVVSIAYGRNPNGSKVSGTSINVCFVGIQPGGNVGTNYSQMCIGNGNATCPGGGGTVGIASYDGNSSGPCGNSAENNCWLGGTGCLGVFSGLLSPGSLSPALIQSDQQYLDGRVNSGARYDAIHNYMKSYARRIAFVAAHECGHSNGLVAAVSDTSTCNWGGSGQCSSTGSHNNCCPTNIMRASLGPTTSDTSQAFSGQPGSVSSSSGCYTGTLASWTMLQSFLGVSP